MAPGDSDWPNDRVETAYKEARAVIEAQNSTMADIDNKAMRTVRLNAVLIGLLLAAANAVDTFIFEPNLLVLSIVALGLSILFGMFTYNESDLYVGPKGEYIEELADGSMGEIWHQDLLQTFSGMITDNGNEIHWNSLLLTISQAGLAIGLGAAILSVLI